MMKKILLISLLSIACTETSAQAPVNPQLAAQYTTDYGNGIYHLDTEGARRVSIYPGQLLSQFKQSHPDCYLTAIAPIVGQLGIYSMYVNCEAKNVSK